MACIVAQSDQTVEFLTQNSVQNGSKMGLKMGPTWVQNWVPQWVPQKAEPKKKSKNIFSLALLQGVIGPGPQAAGFAKFGLKRVPWAKFVRFSLLTLPQKG